MKIQVGDEKHLPYNRPPLSKELWWYGDEKSGRNLKYKSITGKTRDVFFESQVFSDLILLIIFNFRDFLFNRVIYPIQNMVEFPLFEESV